MSEQNQLAVTTQVRETENYVILKDEKGKFSRKAKYASYSSIKAETREEKIWMMNLFEGNEDTGNGLKDHVGKQITVADVITRPYDKVNEETGEIEYGVLTYLFTPEKIAYVTSSKSVYFTLMNIMELFGKPDSELWEDITIQVLKEKATNGDQIKIKMVG